MGDDFASGHTQRLSPLPWRWALLSAALTWVLLIVIMAPVLRAYRLNGDDFALVLNSGTPYFDMSRWAEWFTEGYSDYFNSYPDWVHSLGTDFARPTANLAFHLASWPSRHLGDVAYLLPTYLALGVLAFCVTGLVLRYTAVEPMIAWTAGLAVALAPHGYDALHAASFLTNPLSLALGGAGLLVLSLADRSSIGLAAAAALMVAGVWAHESLVFVVVPVAALMVLSARRALRPNAARFLVLAAPALAFAVSRLALAQSGRVYALQEPSIGARVLYVLAQPFFSVDLYRLWNERMVMASWEFFPFLLACALNVWVVVRLIQLTHRGAGPPALMWGAYACTLVPLLLMPREARFSGAQAAAAAVLLAWIAGKERNPRTSRIMMLAAVMVSGLMLFQAAVVGVDESVARMESAGEAADAAREVIARVRPQTVVIANDGLGYAGAVSMLRLWSWPQTPTCIVVNNIVGKSDPRSRYAIEESAGVVRFANALAPGQRNEFVGSVPSALLPNQGVIYPGGPQAGARDLLASYAVLGPTVVLGFDPASGRPVTPRTLDSPQ